MWKINLIVGVFLLVLGFCINKFKMTYLIAGYNTSSTREKEKYDKDRLVKYIGSLLMMSASILILGGLFSLIFSYYDAIIFFASNILFILFMVVGVIYINVSGCTKK
jgi:hypothetical protein